MTKHHTHEISDHPEVQWALELLKPDPNDKPGILQEYWTEVVCVGSGFALGCFRNFLGRKPYYAGIHIHIALMAMGYVTSQAFNNYMDNYKAERDTKLRDYIIRHPELFPEPVRVKYGEILQEWYPIR